MANYDILGDIAIIKFSDETSKEEKLAKAQELMLTNRSVKTVLEKANKVSGRLRTIKTNFILGENKKETYYKESGCLFKLNVETCYFSPRLANERLEVAKLICKKKNAKVLVMFAGVAPFSIVIAKNSKPSRVVSVELGKDCNKYAKENVIKNKVSEIVEVIQGDVKKIIPKLKEKFDFVIMPRPNLKDSFLKQGLEVSKKGAKIIYYGFSPESKKEEMILELEKEAKKLKRKIKITKVQEAGDIAPYEHRYRIEINVN
jgi:tRNA (guanine37-N1)-methyltransferase